MKLDGRDRLVIAIALVSLVLLVLVLASAWISPEESQAAPHASRAGLQSAVPPPSPELEWLARALGALILALLFGFLHLGRSTRASKLRTLIAAVLAIGALQLCFADDASTARLGLIGVWLLPALALWLPESRAAVEPPR
ncbi:MAG: hypothetical protein RL885_22365 [Planctomycetota bacterium]